MTNLEIIRTYELHAPLCTTQRVYRTSSQTNNKQVYPSGDNLILRFWTLI